MFSSLSLSLNSQVAPTHIHFSGPAEEVKSACYKLFNFGLLSGMPDALENPDYETKLEGEVSLVARTYPKKFREGLQTLAEMELGRELPKPGLLTGKNDMPTWLELVREKAAELHAALFPVKADSEEIAA